MIVKVGIYIFAVATPERRALDRDADHWILLFLGHVCENPARRESGQTNYGVRGRFA